VPSTTKRVYAIMDNLSSHCTREVLLFVLAHPVRRWCSSPNKLLTSIGSSRGGRSCAHWRWRAGGLIPGTKSPMQSTAPQSTGMHLAIPSSGGNAALGPAVHPVSPSCQGPHDFPDAPLSSTLHVATVVIVIATLPRRRLYQSTQAVYPPSTVMTIPLT
jgi:hypothetical protein